LPLSGAGGFARLGPRGGGAVLTLPSPGARAGSERARGPFGGSRIEASLGLDSGAVLLPVSPDGLGGSVILEDSDPDPDP
jgi:hypothetical protein